MRLQHFTSVDDGERIKSVGLVISDHQQQQERKEWIDVKVDVDLPVVRNGALLRAEVLKMVAEKMLALAKQYETTGGNINRTSP